MNTLVRTWLKGIAVGFVGLISSRGLAGATETPKEADFVQTVKKIQASQTNSSSSAFGKLSTVSDPGGPGWINGGEMWNNSDVGGPGWINGGEMWDNASVGGPGWINGGEMWSNSDVGGPGWINGGEMWTNG